MNAPLAGRTTLDLAGIRRAVDDCLARFIDAKTDEAWDERFRQIPETLRGFVLAGGKRLRPTLCVLGWHAAGGQGHSEPVTTAAASLEMFHTFALIHDDIMDDSDKRRGHPTAHRTFADHYSEHTDPRWLGMSVAILLGDLALVYSDELFYGAGLTPDQLQASLPILNAMRSELMHGQYLDLLATGRPTADVEHSLRIIRLKTARYTIERPLHLGAAIGGAGESMLSDLTEFALPLGEAFQLQDDLLGVYGSPEQTGKSTMDDLCSGKHTTLMALGLQLATTEGKRRLTELVGHPDLTEDEAGEVRAILDDSGAHSTVGHMIVTRCRAATRALAAAGLPTETTSALRELVHSANTRPS